MKEKIILGIIGVFVCFVVMLQASHDKTVISYDNYIKGFHDGYLMGLDTINKMMQDVCNDTNENAVFVFEKEEDFKVYFVSKKQLMESNNIY